MWFLVLLMKEVPKPCLKYCCCIDVDYMNKKDATSHQKSMNERSYTFLVHEGIIIREESLKFSRMMGENLEDIGQKPSLVNNI